MRSLAAELLDEDTELQLGDIFVPNNSAHCIHPRIQAYPGIPMLNMNVMTPPLSSAVSAGDRRAEPAANAATHEPDHPADRYTHQGTEPHQ